MSIHLDHDLRAPADPADIHHRHGSPAPGTNDHGAWDGPTVAGAPEDAVRGGISTVARGVGAGLALGANVVRRAGSALGGGRSHRPS